MPGSGYRVVNMINKVLASMKFTFWLGELVVKIIKKYINMIISDSGKFLEKNKSG